MCRLRSEAHNASSDALFVMRGPGTPYDVRRKLSARALTSCSPMFIAEAPVAKVQQQTLAERANVSLCNQGAGSPIVDCVDDAR